MPKQDGNIKIVESFITSNKPMSLNNKNIYYNEYSDEVLIRYYQTLIAVRKDKSVRILEGINKYSASTNVLVRLIERIAKEKGCTVTYVKQFAKGSNVVGVNKYKIKNLNSFDKFYDEIGYTQKELSLPKQDENKNWYTVTNDKSIAEILINEGFVEKYAKGSTVKGGKYYQPDLSSEIAHYKVNGVIFILYDDALDYCDENKLPYSKIIKTKKYAKGSTIKGKDFSGNYYSTNDFVGAHNLQKEAEKILGKGWEAEDDVNQIESIINSVGGKYVVTVPEDRSQWNEMREQYDLAKPTNDSNYDIFVISESDFKYGNGGGVEGGKHYIVKNIKYDADRETQSKLPKELKIIVPNDVQGYEDIEYYISEEISNQTGYAHEGFDTVPEIEDYARGGNMSMGFNYEIGGL